MKDDAEQRVKTNLTLTAIAEAEKSKLLMKISIK